jgi:hypothetical protein
MEKKQTAVEWLMSQIEEKNGKEYLSYCYEFFQQAIKMEREQIEEANIAGMEFIPVDPSRYKSDASEYYTQTFKP